MFIIYRLLFLPQLIGWKGEHYFQLEDKFEVNVLFFFFFLFLIDIKFIIILLLSLFFFPDTCFVVAVVDVTASARHIYYGEELVALVAQEILDYIPWNPKKGGSEIMAYDYIYRHGIALEKYYPYTGVKGKYKKSRKVCFTFN